MKTVFISITRGVVARNVLRAGTLGKLLAHSDVRVVLVVSPRIYPYFREEFSHPRVILEEVGDIVYRRWRKFFIILFNGLTYTDAEYRMLRFGGGGKLPAPRWVYWIKHITFSVLSKIKLLKYLVRFLEQHLFVEKRLDWLFAKYRPDLVFCSSLYSKPDVILIKAAKRLGVSSVSMPKSWDTVGRLFLRAPSDKIIVNNEFMKNWFVREQGVDDGRIIVCGLPQFDVYANKKRFLTKAEFCAQTGLDARKPIILFTSEGKWTAWDETYIDDFITNHKILEKYNLILRPHPSNLEAKLYHRFKRYTGIYVDDEHLRITGMFGDRWDPTEADMDWFAEVLHAIDAAITFMSTVVLDAFACGKPVINIYYELPTDKPVIPCWALYNSMHCRSVLEENATPLAASGAEVMSWIDKFVRDPNLKRRERERVIDKICYKIDGLSSERLYQVISQTLDSSI